MASRSPERLARSVVASTRLAPPDSPCSTIRVRPSSPRWSSSQPHGGGAVVEARGEGVRAQLRPRVAEPDPHRDDAGQGEVAAPAVVDPGLGVEDRHPAAVDVDDARQRAGHTRRAVEAQGHEVPVGGDHGGLGDLDGVVRGVVGQVQRDGGVDGAEPVVQPADGLAHRRRAVGTRDRGRGRRPVEPEGRQRGDEIRLRPRVGAQVEGGVTEAAGRVGGTSVAVMDTTL